MKPQSNELRTSRLPYRAQSVEQLLTQLHEVRKRLDRGEELTFPSVRLHLVSGREVDGYLADLVSTPNGTSVIFETDLHEKQPRLFYTELGKIEAVGLFPKKKAVAEKPAPEPKLKLVPGASKATPRPPAIPISDLDIQRLLISVQSTLSSTFDSTFSVEIGWSTFPKTNQSVTALKKIIELTREALRDLGNISDRKETLRNQITHIKWASHSLTKVEIESGCLLVTAPLFEGKSGFQSANEIFRSIESKIF